MLRHWTKTTKKEDENGDKKTANKWIEVGGFNYVFILHLPINNNKL